LTVEQGDDIAFQAGRLVGALGNVAQGLGEISAGITIAGGGAAGGAVIAPTAVGAAAGVAGIVGGFAIAGNGGMVAGNGAVGVGQSLGNIYNAMVGQGGGGGTGPLVGSQSPADIAGNTSYRPIQDSVTKSVVEQYAQKMANGKFLVLTFFVALANEVIIRAKLIRR
jgi:hypothetical protein